MGCGKSTVGRLLAHELGWPFTDLDEDIETREGVSIADIFEKRGEPEFRSIEKKALERCVNHIAGGRPMVLALGGGAFGDKSTRELLETNGVTIWLDCPFQRICARVEGTSHRPLAHDPKKFKQLYDDRRATYELAEYRIETDTDDAPSTVAAIMNLSLL